MGNYNSNYFDKKEGSLEEAIRMAVTGKLNEDTVILDLEDDNKKLMSDIKKMGIKVKKVSNEPGDGYAEYSLTGSKANLEKANKKLMLVDDDIMNFKESLGAVNEKSIKEGFSPKEIKMAIGIAADPRYKGGNMTGAVKAIEKIKDGLSSDPKVAAVLKKMNEGSKEEYQKFFNAAMKKFKINSPADLKSDEEKKKFFDYVDKNYKGEKDEAYMKEMKKWTGVKENYDIGTPENTKAKLDATPGQSADDWKQQVEVMQKKTNSMRSILADMWGMNEGKNPFEKKEEKKTSKKEDKTMTGKPATKVSVDPDMNEKKK